MHVLGLFHIAIHGMCTSGNAWKTSMASDVPLAISASAGVSMPACLSACLALVVTMLWLPQHYQGMGHDKI